jgi:GNAT superfamily N-acetyltransferase
VFERFTDRARRVVVLAQEEARLLGHNYIGTEHILLGLLHEGEGVAGRTLASLGVSLEEVRRHVEEIIGRGSTGAPTGHIPFTPRAKKVLELSLREAIKLGHTYIGTEHLLLGLVREGEGVAAEVLTRLGADLNRVRQTVMTVVTTGSVPHDALPELSMRAMRDDEFDEWFTSTTQNYARDKAESKGIAFEKALPEARAEMAALLAHRLATEGHTIEVAEDLSSGERLGLLWHARDPREGGREILWLYDIFVEESHRGRGVGRALMRVLEERARETGIGRIELNVFGDNAAARRLYESLGYRESARQLFKELPPEEAAPEALDDAGDLT